MNAGFDDKDGVGQRGDYAVAARKVAALRLGAERKFGNDGALCGNLLVEGKIFCRINDVGAGSEHRHRRSVLFKRIHGAFVRSCINAPRHAGDNQNAGAGQIIGNPGGQFAAVN